MAQREPTARIGFAATVMAAAAERGHAVEDLLAEAGLEPEVLDDPDRRVPLGKYLKVFEACSAATGDPYFTVRFGLGLTPQAMGILGYVMANSITVRAAFENLARYWRLEMEGSKISVEVQDGRGFIRYRFTGASAEDARPEIEGAIGYGVALMRALLADTWSPDEVHLQHAITHDVKTLEALTGADVYSGMPDSALVFPAADLESPIRRADPVLLPILERHAQDMLDAMPKEGDLIGSVRQQIAAALRDGSPTIGAIANGLAMSQRTLQRRLSEAGLTFADLVDTIRYDLSQRYFREPDLAVTEIAFLLGYSEVSAFNRACRRWTGRSPTDCRRALMQEAHA